MFIKGATGVMLQAIVIVHSRHPRVIPLTAILYEAPADSYTVLASAVTRAHHMACRSSRHMAPSRHTVQVPSKTVVGLTHTAHAGPGALSPAAGSQTQDTHDNQRPSATTQHLNFAVTTGKEHRMRHHAARQDEQYEGHPPPEPAQMAGPTL